MRKLLFPSLCLALLSACSAEQSNQPTQETTPAMAKPGELPGMPLKSLADQINLAIGAAVETRHLEDPLFRQVLIRDFSQITPENEMKFSYVQPERGQFDFSKADQLVEFAEEHDMVVKGHALVWHIQNPKWLEETKWTKEELSEVLEQHIKTVVGHYKGRVAYWDVVNEAFNDNGTFRETLWYQVLGEEYIEMAFRWAHEADPDAVLFYNDYSTEAMGPKSNAVYRHLKALLDKGVPIHGVGTQLHLMSEYPIGEASIARNIERFSEIGLDTHFTEIDVRMRDSEGQAGLNDQAKHYETLMKLAAYYPEVDMYTTWGLSDKYSWVPSWFEGYGRALMLDKDYRAKPAYLAVQDVLVDAVTGNFGYEPITDLSNAKRHVSPFNAKPLSSESLNAEAVVYYPFVYNQLNGKDQRLPNSETVSGKWGVGYYKNKLIGQVIRSDETTVTNHSLVHENDNVEVFIRLGEQYWQFRSIVGQDFAPLGFPGKASGTWSDDGKVFDFVIEFDGFEDLVGETLGFNIALSDNDNDTDDGNRKAQLYPLTGNNVGWQGEEFGELFMNGQNAVVSPNPISTPPTFSMSQLSKAPSSSDDAVWENAYRYSFAFNQLNQRDMSFDDTDVSGSWQVGVHGKWLYGVVERQDDVTFTGAEQSYENDNVEVFVQQGDKDMTQFRTVVGKGFEPTNYALGYEAQWNEEGTQLMFAIELDSELKDGESIQWNIALSDNDGEGRNYQLYPVPGSNMSYLGEELTRITLR
ncbi:hypothetical protein BCU83_01295 [Vibrio breoganii]|uniref:Beta-xylanase n=1 Tax=Vibrio breoganii TaxID=553239 RepID=A0AAN0XW71_9VIBR|nr:endo-1,4-beta-xylanase [Vibrio breoganii]ANO33761.1 hypothetical protein A6E01_11250 [Vibrio breoganii]PMG79093.1 hypothetical protein BCU83_01295 [Vibrio breoganii]PMO58645.1 hypothetical protein BCT07_11120 [Vibrio breoganii]